MNVTKISAQIPNAVQNLTTMEKLVSNTKTLKKQRSADFVCVN